NESLLRDCDGNLQPTSITFSTTMQPVTQNYTWVYNNVNQINVDNITIKVETTPMPKIVVPIIVTNNICYKPTLSVYIAGTDFSDPSKYIQDILINNISFGICNPGYENECTANYSCISEFTLYK